MSEQQDVRVVWREGKPETARFASNWLHAEWLKFRIGFPAYRVSDASLVDVWWNGNVTAFEIALALEYWKYHPTQHQRRA